MFLFPTPTAAIQSSFCLQILAAAAAQSDSGKAKFKECQILTLKNDTKFPEKSVNSFDLTLT